MLLSAAGNIAHSSQSGLPTWSYFFELMDVYLSFVSARVAISLRCFSDAGPQLSVLIPNRPVLIYRILNY